MLGAVIGVVASAAIFTFFGKDQKAAKELKDQRKAERQRYQAQIKKMEQQKEKMKADPQLLKQKQEKDNRIKQKLFKNLSETEQKQLMEFFEKGRKEGKSDGEIIKQATSQAQTLMCVMFLVFIVLLGAIVVLLAGESPQFNKMKQDFGKLVTLFYPKLMMEDIPQNPIPVPQL